MLFNDREALDETNLVAPALIVFCERRRRRFWVRACVPQAEDEMHGGHRKILGSLLEESSFSRQHQDTVHGDTQVWPRVVRWRGEERSPSALYTPLFSFVFPQARAELQKWSARKVNIKSILCAVLSHFFNDISTHLSVVSPPTISRAKANAKKVRRETRRVTQAIDH